VLLRRDYNRETAGDREAESLVEAVQGIIGMSRAGEVMT
jgi:hypothetical protein